MKYALIGAAGLVLAGCGVSKPQTHDQFVASAVSAVSGAAIGSYVGGQFGNGAGNIIMMIFGGVVGGMGGWSYGATLMPSDREAFRQSTQKAMESTPDGEVVTWVNPETKVAGAITPTGGFVGKGGLFCRSFEATIATKDEIGRGRGTACRTEAGEWQVFGLTDNNA